MCLANQVCDSLLLSAPFSTFGFWMAYLLPEVHSFLASLELPAVLWVQELLG
uniref:Uncharacterized protein n=1 Tax=Meloidogyne incognita TaxID=6306 RepID=A0A914MGZ4_MELIC